MNSSHRVQSLCSTCVAYMGGWWLTWRGGGGGGGERAEEKGEGEGEGRGRGRGGGGGRGGGREREGKYIHRNISNVKLVVVNYHHHYGMYFQSHAAALKICSKRPQSRDWEQGWSKKLLYPPKYDRRSVI